MCSCAGLPTSQGWKSYVCSKQSSSVRSKKERAIVVLKGNVTRTSWRDSLHRQESTISQSWQEEASDGDSWHLSLRKASRKFEAERHNTAEKGKKKQEADRASSLSNMLCPNLIRDNIPLVEFVYLIYSNARWQLPWVIQVSVVVLLVSRVTSDDSYKVPYFWWFSFLSFD